jgi:membrane protease YdiL (CAAX protease family)
MDKKFGYYIFGGLLIGTTFGMFWVKNGNLVLSIAIGALIGTAIGWFAAAYAQEKGKNESD